MKKFLVLALALAVLTRSGYAANCDGLQPCDSCQLFTLPDGTVEAQDPVEDCVVDSNGIETLNCSCPDPPEGSTPANSRAAEATPSPNPADDNGDDVNDLPPDGGTGTRLPTQSYGDPAAPNGAAASASLSAAILAAGALAAAAVVLLA